MNLVKRDEFDVLKKMVQRVLIENDELKKTQKKPIVRKKKTINYPPFLYFSIYLTCETSNLFSI